MFSLARLIFITAWIWNVQARNETLVQGWQSEPPGRGTWSILWSCLATIFICTWSALHLDVPEDHGAGYLLFRKIRWMLVAATAPEYLLWTSASNFLEARDLSKYLEARGYREWSQTQTQFASARGFETHPTQGTYSRCSLDELREHIETRRIDRPPISKKELKARGKSDWVGKLIAVLQIIWFVVQTLFRAIQHYQITALEIMTVAFVFCSVFIYGFCLRQPQNVEYPVVLDLASETRHPAQTKDETRSRRIPYRPDPAVGTIVHNFSSPLLSLLGRGRSGFPREHVLGWVPGWVPGRVAKRVPIILLALSACGFGAIHCLAWNSPFPTSMERVIWRICSVTTTALPAILALLLHSLAVFKCDGSQQLLDSAALSMGLVYTIGRAMVIVLAFMTLRALPTGAFQTVNWSDYFPHFAA